jgi:hypothetical protein
LAVPGALLFQLIVGSGAEIVLHLVLGVGFLLTAFTAFDFEPPRWLPWVGCLSIGASRVTFLLQGITPLLHTTGLTYLAFKPRATVRSVVRRGFLVVVQHSSAVVEPW